ncbi:MAG TPA: hypothetical protein VH088_01785 [Terriglobales bacterium]|jgi:hypothetical protein|nr:hypothetical protein [Terriglobales bacterium]
MPPAKKEKQPKKARSHRKSFLHHHSLGIASLCILALWIVLYSITDPNTHWGSFFGNAIADWTGVVLAVFGTKYLYEKGSAESRRPRREPNAPFWRLCYEHSLLLFLIPTGAIWVAIYVHSKVDAKWGGEVVGNIVSEWTQLIGLLLLTKKLVEQHSKESGKG